MASVGRSKKRAISALVTAWEPPIRALWASEVREALDDGIEVHEVDPAALSDERRIAEALRSHYSLVMLPLTLPNYMSVRLAERVHCQKSPTRLILRSGTDLEPDTILGLFDAYIPTGQFAQLRFSHSPLQIIRKALKEKARRVASPTALHRRIEAVLQSPCFRIGQIYGPLRHLPAPTVEQYRATVVRPKLSDPQADPGRGRSVGEEILDPDLFVSYSHKDLKWLEMLETALRPLTRERKIFLWSDKQIPPGRLWKVAIQRALESAKAAVLLVSLNFMASDFIAKYELPLLLEAAANRGMRILWLAVSSSSLGEFAKHQGLNDPAKPLDKLRVPERKAELVRIAQKIEAELLR